MEAIKTLCKAKGMTHAEIISAASIYFEPSLIMACEQNACGNYGSNWRCPPAAPGIEETERRVKAYDKGVVMQYIGELEDPFDFDGMMKQGVVFKGMLADVMDELRERDDYADMWVMGVGGCSLCNPCAYVDNEPCRFPEKSIYSMEACGIMVNDLVETAGLSYNNGPNTVSYVALVLHK